MDLKKLPPSMLILLGLGTTEACQPCLGPPYDPPVDSASTSTSSSSSSSVSATSGLTPPGDTVTPCLSIGEESSGFATGPADSGTASSTGTGSTGTDNGTSGSDSDSGDASSSVGESTIGPCLAPPGIEDDDQPSDMQPASPDAPSAATRHMAVERLLERGVLPDDVAKRLRRSLDD